MEVMDGGPLVQLGQNASFINAVAKVTASTVAPGAEWVRDAEKEEEQELHNKLQSLGVRTCTIAGAIQQWRSLRQSGSL
jgi:hypothetical protein